MTFDDFVGPRVWTCKGFAGFYPVGTAAVAVARNEEEARANMDAVLREHGLPGLGDGDTLEELVLLAPFTRVLCDGEY